MLFIIALLILPKVNEINCASTQQNDASVIRNEKVEGQIIDEEVKIIESDPKNKSNSSDELMEAKLINRSYASSSNESSVGVLIEAVEKNFTKSIENSTEVNFDEDISQKVENITIKNSSENEKNLTENLDKNSTTEFLINVTKSVEFTSTPSSISLNSSQITHQDSLSETGKANVIFVLFGVVFIIMSIALYVKHKQTRSEEDLVLVRNVYA